MNERFVTIGGVSYPVLITDDRQALQAALAAGRAVVEVIGDGPMTGAKFAVEREEDADQNFLERVVRRNLGLPWIIAETKRLIIREFTRKDAASVLPEPGDRDGDRIFYSEERLEQYIKNQYGFYQYGIWALEDRQSGRLIGKAGVTDREDAAYGANPLELGYHVFEAYRRRGYAKEACEGIIQYVERELERDLLAEIEPDNEASISLIRRLGFQPLTRRYSGEGKYNDLYVRCWKTAR